MDPVERTRDYYNAFADKWTAAKTNSFHHQAQFELFIDKLPHSGTVIDIGCASGVHVPLFLGIGRHFSYLGIDISTSFLAIAQARYPQLTFQEGNIADLQTLPQEKFIGFWAASVLMHIPYESWPTMFENIESISVPQAIGYLCLPIERPSETETERHFTILSPDQQVAELEKNNWTILHQGILDGSNKKALWHWYIIQLP